MTTRVGDRETEARRGGQDDSERPTCRLRAFKVRQRHVNTHLVDFRTVDGICLLLLRYFTYISYTLCELSDNTHICFTLSSDLLPYILDIIPRMYICLRGGMSCGYSRDNKSEFKKNKIVAYDTGHACLFFFLFSSRRA